MALFLETKKLRGRAARSFRLTVTGGVSAHDDLPVYPLTARSDAMGGRLSSPPSPRSSNPIALAVCISRPALLTRAWVVKKRRNYPEPLRLAMFAAP